MSYLQVICEQHRLVEQHMDRFATPPGEESPMRESLPSGDPKAMAAVADKRLQAAMATGILDLMGCGTAHAISQVR